MLSVEEIRSTDRLKQIAGPWQALGDSIPGTTPFQLPPWQTTWWKHFGSGELQSYAFWDGSRLSGLIPAFRHQWVGREQLTLIGSGVSDYLEPLLGDRSAVDLLSRELTNNRTWDVCVWQDLASETPLLEIKGLHVSAEAEVPCSAIDLNDRTFQEFWARRGSDLRRNIRRYANKAEAQGGPVQFRVQAFQGGLVDALIALHGARWQKQGDAGTVATNRSAEFLRDVTRNESCRAFILEWKGEIVAITAGFLRNKIVYSYLSAFDPRHEILGFGRLLLFRSLQWAFENKYECWDFLRGEEAYKASWGAAAMPKLRLVITRL